jgi:hypothetical protein
VQADLKNPEDVLPDVLGPGLRVVFCGTPPVPSRRYEVPTMPALVSQIALF